MPILRLGDHIRLTGKEAVTFKRVTGRQTLPKTVQEHNHAIQETIEAWLEFDDSPEARLIAAVLEEDFIS